MMSVDALDLTYACGLPVERNVPLGPYTSLKIGGPADFFVRARSAAELARTMTAAHRLGLPWLLLGGGSNALIADRGFRGLAIKVEAQPGQRNRGQVLWETAEAVELRCEAGVLSAGLARWTAGLGWHGFEWAAGIPGTVGGAAAGNAGAYDGDMARCVQRVAAWFPDGERVIEVAALGYGYRTSRFKRGAQPGAILSVDLRLTRGEADAALAKIESFERQRREKQPTERSCGSVFKNPPPPLDSAGRLLDLAGLKGTAIGDAEISHKHANFFVNRGRATAADVLALIRQARQRVEAVHGVRLEVEILLTGDWQDAETEDL
ncbi:MAG TPA: UDP-N-acetylmuramate dehydrogenase [Chloroflexota bacterium]|nr:UDP-N-acetylmuramate dehydrogenase [Chloroflexota bacterium]